MTIEGKFTISEEHKCLAGHFPDYPVVPAVVIIDNIVSIIQTKDKTARLVKIKHMKFMKPLFPNVECKVIIEMKDSQQVKVNCYNHEGIIAQGQFELHCEAME